MSEHNIFVLCKKANWFGFQYNQQQVITVLTFAILHRRLDVTAITYIHDIPKSVCNWTQAKKSIPRHHICLNDSDYDYILGEVYRQNKLGLKEM